MKKRNIILGVMLIIIIVLIIIYAIIFIFDRKKSILTKT